MYQLLKLKNLEVLEWMIVQHITQFHQIISGALNHCNLLFLTEGGKGLCYFNS